MAEENKKKPNPIDTHVGSRIRLRRNMIGMSQEKLGESLGITFQQIQKYEKGMNRISVARLVDIAKILNVDIDFFFDGIKSGKTEAGFADSGAPPYVADMMSTPEGLQLVRTFASIKSSKIRKSIVQLVSTLAAQEEVERSS